MLANQDFFKDEKNILVIYGDVLTDLNYKELINYHERQNNLATIVCQEVENIEEKGMLVIDSNNHVVDFKEKPKKEDVMSNYANGGIYVFKTSLFDQLKPFVDKKPLDFGQDIFPFMLAQHLPISAYKFNGFLLDIGQPNNYRLANEKIHQLNL